MTPRVEEDRDAPREKPRLTRTDRIVTGVAVLILAALLVAIYFYYLESRRFLTCQGNLNQLGRAMQLYMADTGGRLPPLYDRDPSGDVQPDPAGRPRTWILVVVPFVPSLDVFRCPSAPKSHQTVLSNPKPVADAGTVELTYGMSAAMDAADRDAVSLPGGTALLAETIAGGHDDSYDPLPLAGGNDGFLIGYDDSNRARTGETRRVTRLAVTRLDGGKDWAPGNTVARHRRHGVVTLFVDGHVQTLPPDSMFFSELDEQWRLLWSGPTP